MRKIERDVNIAIIHTDNAASLVLEKTDKTEDPAVHIYTACPSGIACDEMIYEPEALRILAEELNTAATLLENGALFKEEEE